MGETRIEQRKFTFCSTLAGYPLDRLITQCPDCDMYFAACCVHQSFGGDWYEPEDATCHHFRLVFTDGACSNNGKVCAKAGLGIIIGNDDCSWSISVDDEIDCGAPRTSQRAELLAAIEGLKKLHELYLTNRVHNVPSRRRKKKERPSFIVTTDSEYVTRGITEWFPLWRRRGWRTSDGRCPSNLDLFIKLDEYITNLEQDRIEVGFWHIPRAYNRQADSRAKSATDI